MLISCNEEILFGTKDVPLKYKKTTHIMKQIYYFLRLRQGVSYLRMLCAIVISPYYYVHKYYFSSLIHGENLYFGVTSVS